MKELKKLRAGLRLTQAQAAALLGVTANHLAQVERGVKKPSAMLRKLIALLPRLARQRAYCKRIGKLGGRAEEAKGENMKAFRTKRTHHHSQEEPS